MSGVAREVAVALAEDFAALAVLHDRELDADMIAALQAAGFPDGLAMLPGSIEACACVDAMCQGVAGLPASGDSAGLDALAADFAAIYLNGAYGASPCESYWLSDDHLVCQDAMFELRGVYLARGLAAPDWRSRPDDHLVHQLQFIAHCLESVHSDDDWRAIGQFLDFHLLRWLADFAGRVVERCDTPFYAALAVLTRAWVGQLRELIANHLGEAALSADEVAVRLGSRRVAEPEAMPLRFIPGGTGPSW